MCLPAFPLSFLRVLPRADLAQLKYHFGLWFTNYGKQIVEDNVLAFVNCCPEETCGGECDGPEHARFWYGTTQVPCSPGHFDVPGPPRTKKKGKKSKNKARVRMAEITMAFECDACASDKTITAAADSELAVAETPATDEQAFDPAMSRPTHPVAVPSDHTAPGAPSPIASPRADTPHPPRLPTRYRPQTCFCEVCLDPPARYARLDDSDQED